MLKLVNVLIVLQRVFVLSLVDVLALCNYVLGPASQESSLLPRVLRCALIRADS